MPEPEQLIDSDFDFEVDESQAREHLPRAGTARTSEGTRRGRRPSKRLDNLQKALSAEMFSAGTILGFALNTTGYYICQESDPFTKAVIELAAKKPEWIQALEHVADVGPGITIGKTTLGIAVAIGVDRERIKPDKAIAKLLGVTAAYMKAHDITEGDFTNAAGNGFAPPPHGAFVPVT